MADFAKTVALLNRIFALEQFSLANYLMDAHPWVHRGDERLVEVVRAIARDQQEYAEQVGRWIVEHEASLAPACYPMRYTAFNDVSIEFLMDRLVEEQRHIVEELERLVPELQGTGEPYELAQQILGSEKAHLENLQEALAAAEAA
ncbi:MAG: hypothetical protein KatS3mg110_2233 [Pirellulaceae bacterium]|nr:MAG: hypothetical protein KatS3mg110_2233 [Pirellulaceae bacterium]